MESEPLKKHELHDPERVRQALNSDHLPPTEDKEAVHIANTMIGTSTARTGGESAPTQADTKGVPAGEKGGPTSGVMSGGLKGTAGSNATAGGPFQSESGQTLKTDKRV